MVVCRSWQALQPNPVHRDVDDITEKSLRIVDHLITAIGDRLFQRFVNNRDIKQNNYDEQQQMIDASRQDEEQKPQRRRRKVVLRIASLLVRYFSNTLLLLLGYFFSISPFVSLVPLPSSSSSSSFWISSSAKAKGHHHTPFVAKTFYIILGALAVVDAKGRPTIFRFSHISLENKRFPSLFPSTTKTKEQEVWIRSDSSRGESATTLFHTTIHNNNSRRTTTNLCLWCLCCRGGGQQYHDGKNDNEDEATTEVVNRDHEVVVGDQEIKERRDRVRFSGGAPGGKEWSGDEDTHHGRPAVHNNIVSHQGEEEADSMADDGESDELPIIEEEAGESREDDDGSESFSTTTLNERETRRRSASDAMLHFITPEAFRDYNEERMIEVGHDELARGEGKEDVASMQGRALLQLMMQRRDTHLQDVLLLAPSNSHPSPKRLLHVLVPKIPAVRQSPDPAMRIQSAQPRIDAGLGAAAAATLAHVLVATTKMTKASPTKTVDMSKDLWCDRRMEQLIECILCGVDVGRRREEYRISRLEQVDGEGEVLQQGRREDHASHKRKRKKKESDQEDGNDDVNDDDHGGERSGIQSNNGKDVMVDDDTASLLHVDDPSHPEWGLSIRAACRAAWGLSIILALRHSEHGDSELPATPPLLFPILSCDEGDKSTDSRGDTSSTTDMSHLLLALALRVRELLLGRIQRLLRREDLWIPERYDHIGGSKKDEEREGPASMEDKLAILSRDIAQDAALAMWTFASVRALLVMDDRGQSASISPLQRKGSQQQALQAAIERVTETTASLFKVCSSILCQNPVELRQRAQQEDDAETIVHAGRVGSNDVVDRLALSEEADQEEMDGSTSKLNDKMVVAENDEDHSAESESDTEDGNVSRPTLDQKIENIVEDIIEQASNPGVEPVKEKVDCGAPPNDVMVDCLAPQEVLDVVWALAVQGSKDGFTSKVEKELSETAATLCEVSFDRLLAWVLQDLQTLRMEREKLNVRAQHVSPEATVVDASTLLAAEKIATSAVNDEHSTVESMTIRNSEEEGDYEEEVVVVDAALLLASEAESRIPRVVEDQSMLTDPDPPHHFLNDDLGDDSYYEQTNPGCVDDVYNEHVMTKLLFSLKDLSSMMWAATELRDPLRCKILDGVCSIVLERGENSLLEMSGDDLSHLAWAIASCANQEAEMPTLDRVKVVTWLARTAFAEASSGEDGVVTNLLLERFLPSELSRLLWSIACVLSPHHWQRATPCSVPGELACIGLLAASENMAFFDSEDLARLAWSFLELNDLKAVFLHLPYTMDALGKVLTRIELDLIQWESGGDKHHSTGFEEMANDATKEGFSLPFFGRTRSRAVILQRQLEEATEESEDLNTVSSFTKSKPPQLKDLPVDPSTLCKLVCSCNRVDQQCEGVVSCGTLGQVALRLMTSRSGRLLRECPVHDLVRICEAATTMTTSNTREIISLFSRRVTRVLNDSSDLLKLKSTPPIVLAYLIGSLGELGVKHTPEADGHAAYKKMHLTLAHPFVDVNMLDSLPDLAFFKMVAGLVRLNVMESTPDYMDCVLDSLESRVDSLLENVPVCDVMELLVDIYGVESLQEAAVDVHNTTTVENLKNESRSGRRGLPRSEALVLKATERAMDQIPGMTTGELRRLSRMIARMPEVNSTLIDAIRTNMNQTRENLINQMSNPTPPNEVLAQARSSATFLSELLFEDEGRGRPFSAIKDRFASWLPKLNQKNSTKESDDDDDFSSSEGQQNLVGVEKALASIADLATVDLTHRMYEREAKLFELGRCEELLANSQIDQNSNGDGLTSKALFKRLPSRIIPKYSVASEKQ